MNPCLPVKGFDAMVQRCMYGVVWFCCSVTQSFQLFATPWTVAPQLLCPWDSPSKNTGVGCYVLLQRIFPTQG